MHTYFVYIWANQCNTLLYTGMTNDLAICVWQHKHGQGCAFTRKYRCSKLVYYETFEDVTKAIAPEKQIKAGSRKKKGQLVESINPGWLDLDEELGLCD